MDGQFRIDSMFAFVVVDDDGTEGIPTIDPGEGMPPYPMIGGDLAMVEILRPMAQAWARQNGKLVTLVHFSKRTVQEVYGPDGSVSPG